MSTIPLAYTVDEACSFARKRLAPGELVAKKDVRRLFLRATCVDLSKACQRLYQNQSIKRRKTDCVTLVA